MAELSLPAPRLLNASVKVFYRFEYGRAGADKRYFNPGSQSYPDSLLCRQHLIDMIDALAVFGRRGRE